MSDHVIIWESKPRKIILHLTPEVFEYIAEAIDNDALLHGRRWASANKVIQETRAAILSGPHNE